MELLLDSRKGSQGLRGLASSRLLILTLLFCLFMPGPAEAGGKGGRGGEAQEGPSAEKRQRIMAGVFSASASTEAEGAMAAQWKPLVFPSIEKHTEYSIQESGRSSYMRAASKASASALYRDLDFNLAEFPVLSWRWKIDGVLPKGDARVREGDDFAARLYVTFAYDGAGVNLLERMLLDTGEMLLGRRPPGRAITYIWANRLKKGDFILNPNTPREIMVAVESGNEKSGLWIAEERNVYEDYRKAFGHEPPRVAGIALMTDSDNTGGSATGYYDDIIFKKSAAAKR